jgi:hypothetical protein
MKKCMLVSKKTYSAIDDAAAPRESGWGAARGWLGGLAHAICGFGHGQSSAHIEVAKVSGDSVNRLDCMCATFR